MNPPFNDPERQRSSPDRSAPSLPIRFRGTALVHWVKTAARLLRPRGTLTMIWRADGLAEVLRALEPAFGAVTVLPVHSRTGDAAIRFWCGRSKASRAPLAILPGLFLNDAPGGPLPKRPSVLRDGAALPLSEI